MELELISRQGFRISVRENGCIMEKRWHIQKTDEEQCAALAAAIGKPPAMASLLLHRGITTAKEADIFLHPERQEFFDPFLMQDMDKAVERIASAIDKKEKIVVYGDYDVDGITATALLVHNLKELGADAEYYIPDRLKEGYGFNVEALQRLAAAGTQLLISVDCGISAVDVVREVADDMDIIITDHHLPGEALPAALAVLDPHRADCSYPCKDLCGVGVVFKLSQALWRKMRDKAYNDDLEIVALGTVADIVPLQGENRHIVKEGLAKMLDTSFLGLRALIEAAGLKDKVISSGQVGFVLAPRLNAAGRMGSALQGVDLLLTHDEGFARQTATQLNDVNTERQSIEKEIFAQAEQQMQEYDLTEHRVIVLAGEGWHPGVIGIVASRLVEKYYRPAVVISSKDGIGKGSCRSIAGFHMYEALQSCGQLLLGFGGHAQAAGLSLEMDKLDGLRTALDRFAVQHLGPEDYVPCIDIDFEMDPLAVTTSLIADIAELEPYGMGNPKPLFGCHDVRGSYAHALGRDGQHLKFQIESQGKRVDALYWHHAEMVPLVNAEPLDMAYVPGINEWNGHQSVQCVVNSFKSAQSAAVFPDRAVLGKIYLFLRSLQRAKGMIPFDEIELASLYAQAGGKMSPYTMGCARQIFQEIGLLARAGGEACQFLPLSSGQKLDLHQSELYCRGREKG